MFQLSRPTKRNKKECQENAGKNAAPITTTTTTTEAFLSHVDHVKRKLPMKRVCC